MITMPRVPEFAAVRLFVDNLVSSGKLDYHILTYEKCRPDKEFNEFLYRTVLLSAAAFIIVILIGLISFVAGVATGTPVSIQVIIYAPVAGAIAAIAVYYARMFSIRSLKDYRGALMDANAVHAVGFMLTMAESNVPLKRMFQNLSNLGSVYGEDIALESTYIVSLVDEDGMDIVSAIGTAQSTSPSAIWQELLIGISGVCSSGGSLREYLKGRYQALCERKRIDVRKYNDSVQGLSSIYLSIAGIAAIFIALINLVFNIASLLSNDSLVWLDAIVVVPLGSFTVIRVLMATNPEV